MTLAPKTQNNSKRSVTKQALLCLCVLSGFVLGACAAGRTPSARSVNIPAPTTAQERQRAINESGESLMVVPLGRDVLVPLATDSDPLPDDKVGPFELRNEPLASALQLILDGHDVPMAFESDKGLTSKITVSNLRGPLNKVVEKVCSLADLYCLYKDGILTLKETQTFTVSMPPIDLVASGGGGGAAAPAADPAGGGGGGATAAAGGGGGGFSSISSGLAAITGSAPVIDSTTRTMIYTATSRTAERAQKYFERLRTNTAMIVYETYIWEVSLTGGNSAGINWDELKKIGKYNVSLAASGAVSSTLGNPISIGLPTVNATPSDILKFISSQGATKTISQPQITMLSGTSSQLKVVREVNYIRSLTRSEPTTNNASPTISTTVDKVNTGLTLNIKSSWDDSTVYGAVGIEVNADPVFRKFDTGDGNTLELPEIASRNLTTQVRVRPGDTILIAGIVSETQRGDSSGLGMEKPWIPTSRTQTSDNSELVFLLRPRVIVFKPEDEILKERAQNLALFNPTAAQEEHQTEQVPAFSAPVAPKATIPTKPKRKPAPAALAKKVKPKSDTVQGTLTTDLLNPAGKP